MIINIIYIFLENNLTLIMKMTKIFHVIFYLKSNFFQKKVFLNQSHHIFFKTKIHLCLNENILILYVDII